MLLVVCSSPSSTQNRDGMGLRKRLRTPVKPPHIGPSMAPSWRSAQGDDAWLMDMRDDAAPSARLIAGLIAVSLVLGFVAGVLT